MHAAGELENIQEAIKEYLYYNIEEAILGGIEQL